MKRLLSKAKTDDLRDKRKSSDSDSSNETLLNKKRHSAMQSKSSSNSKVASSGKPAVEPAFLSLKYSMEDRSLQVYKDNKFVCIRDKYPKARCHLLLIPIGIQLLKVQDLLKIPNCLDFLNEIKTKTFQLIEEHVPKDLKKNVLIGFHAIQSMNPLHMHIITSEFQSDCLKNKKHWNSFNTPYFIKINDLINHLEVDLDHGKKDYFTQDKFNLNKTNVLKEYLNLDLKCNQCKITLSNMPNLKKHLATH
jgi:aprataxin